MFNRKKLDEKSGLEKAIDELLSEMKNFHGDDEEYAKMVAQLDTLYKLKEVDHKVETGKRVSAETWAVIGGNLLGIVMIVSHERAHVLTSKALGFVSKVR